MYKTLLLSAIFFIYSSLSVTSLGAGTGCGGNDVQFNRVTITEVTASSITYEYEIENTGDQVLLLSKLTIQNYVSEDPVFQISDAAAGGAVLSTGSTDMAPGTSYTGTFTAYFTGSLKTYHYLIVQLNYTDGECDLTNNEKVTCTLPDPQLSNLEITNIGSSYIGYNFTIENKGGDTLFFNRLVIQNYLSQNNTYEPDDAAAGGAIMSFATQPYLLANQSYSGNFGANSNAISSYSYLITMVYLSSGEECPVNNNEAVKPLSVTSVTNPLSSEADFVLWDRSSRKFTVSGSANKVLNGSLTYRLYSASGLLLQSGTTAINNPTGLFVHNEGICILIISDGSFHYSKKILY